MSRLIDADAIMDDLNDHADYADMLIKDIREYIAEQPTVDAVQVVRCRDCEFNAGSSCDYSVMWLRPNGYCSWGRRREEDE